MSYPGHKTLQLRSRLPIALLLFLTFQQLIQPHRVWMVLWVGIASWLLVSYFWALNLHNNVHVSRETHGQWVVVGDRLREQFSLHNEGSLPVLWATVRDHSDVPGYHIDRVAAAEAGHKVQWRTQGVCQRRGVFTLGPWSVEMGDPFGLFKVTQHYPAVQSLVVYPRIMQLPELLLLQGRARGRAPRQITATQPSVVVERVRPYVPGDSRKHIHWRSSAHHQQWMVRQFAQEPFGDVWLILDLDAAVQVGTGQESTLEYGIILAASLAAHYLHANRGVGLVAYGQEAVLLSPQRGQHQLWRILEALAQAAPSGDWPLPRVLQTVRTDLGRGRTAIVLTPSTEDSWLGRLLALRRQDVSVGALLLDAGSFATPPSPSLQLGLQALRKNLADLNVPTQIIASGYPFRPLITYKRKRTILRTLSGTGRVIAVEIEEEV